MGEGNSPPPVEPQASSSNIDDLPVACFMYDSCDLVALPDDCGLAGSGPTAEPMDLDMIVSDEFFFIPDQIPDSEFEEFVQEIKSTLGRGYIVTVDRAARTMKFDRPSLKLMPGPALNHDGFPELITYIVTFPEERATKLKDAWQEIELTLHGYSISCDLNLADCSMQVWTTTSLEDIYMIGKARDLLELLSRTPVPLHMAFEIFKDVRQQRTINIGFQKDGLCAKFEITKDDYSKRWDFLFCSLEALSKAACCHIFLNEDTFTAVTVTAVGSSVERTLVQTVVEAIIMGKERPLTSITMDKPHAKHMQSLNRGPLSNKDGVLEACSLYALLHENRVSKLQESLPILEASLRNYGISYTLDNNYLVMSIIRGTKEPDVIDKAWQLFELLSTTHVPASMAIEVLNGMQTCLIKIGYQGGGLSSLFRIKEEEYSKRWECIRHSLEILAETVGCNVFLNDDTVAAVGKASVEMIKQLVQNCILNNACPGTAARNYYIISQGIDIEDPHKLHVEMENSGSAMSIMPDLSSFCTFFFGQQATLLGKYFKDVEAFLKDLNFSCQLFTEAEHCYMIVSKTTNTGDSDISNKIWDFLKLLSTGVEPLKAMEAVTGRRHYDFIPTGYRYGKFCSKAGISEEDFSRVVWPRIKLGLEEISPRLKCECFVFPDVVTVVGHTGVAVLREFVLQCFCLRMPTGISLRAMINGRSVCPYDPEFRALLCS